MYQSVRCAPPGQLLLPPAITQRCGLLAIAGTQTEPAAQPPPRSAVAQKRVVVVQVGVLAVGVPVAVQPGYIGVICPTPTPKTIPVPLVCQVGTMHWNPEEKFNTLLRQKIPTMHWA